MDTLNIAKNGKSSTKRGRQANNFYLYKEKTYAPIRCAAFERRLKGQVVEEDWDKLFTWLAQIPVNDIADLEPCVVRTNPEHGGGTYVFWADEFKTKHEIQHLCYLHFKKK